MANTTLLEQLNAMLDSKFGAFESKIEANFDKKFDDMDKKITGIETRLTKRIDTLENKMNMRFTKVETRISNLETDVKKINTRLTDFEKNYNYYIRHGSEIQEGYLTDKLYNYLNENMPTKFIQKLPLHYVYRQDGSQITDLDGCIIIKSRDNINNNSNKNNKTRKHPYLRIKPIMVIIEAKRTPDKLKVDEKLEQVYELLSTNKAYRLYHGSTFVTSLDEQGKYDEIILMIGSDYIPNSIHNYINYINEYKHKYDNETEDEYNSRKREEYRNLSLEMANEDLVYRDIKEIIGLKKIDNITNLEDQLYSIQYNSTSKLFRYNSTIQHWKAHTYDYMKPYFELLHEHIGFVTPVAIEFPEQNITLENISSALIRI